MIIEFRGHLWSFSVVRKSQTRKVVLLIGYLYLHSIIGCDDGIVGVYQRAFAASHGDWRLQAATSRRLR